MPRLVLVTLSPPRTPAPAGSPDARRVGARGLLAVALGAAVTAFATGLAGALGGALAHVVTHEVVRAAAWLAAEAARTAGP